MGLFVHASTRCDVAVLTVDLELPLFASFFFDVVVTTSVANSFVIWCVDETAFEHSVGDEVAFLFAVSFESSGIDGAVCVTASIAVSYTHLVKR